MNVCGAPPEKRLAISMMCQPGTISMQGYSTTFQKSILSMTYMEHTINQSIVTLRYMPTHEDLT